MQIKVTFIGKENTIDILLDNRQRIADTLDILEEKGELNFDKEAVCYVKSKRRNRKIPIFSTYEQEMIYSGDLLKICDIDM